MWRQAKRPTALPRPPFQMGLNPVDQQSIAKSGVNDQQNDVSYVNNDSLLSPIVNPHSLIDSKSKPDVDVSEQISRDIAEAQALSLSRTFNSRPQHHRFNSEQPSGLNSFALDGTDAPATPMAPLTPERKPYPKPSTPPKKKPSLLPKEMLTDDSVKSLSKITDGSLMSRMGKTLAAFDLGAFEAMFDRFSDQISGESGDFALSLVSLFYKLYRLRDIADLFFAAFDFIRSIVPHSQMSTIVSEIKKYIIAGVKKLYNTLIMAPVEPESRVLDLLISVKGNLGTVLNSELVTALRDFILGLVSFRFFNREKASNITKMLGPAKSVDGLGFLETTLEAGIQLFTAADRYDDKKSINEILCAENPVNAFLREVRDLELNSNMLYTGMPVDGKICIREYAYAVVKCKDAGDAIYKSTPSRAPTFRTVGMARRIIHQIHSDLTSRMSGVKRDMPYVLAAVGPPGVGKGLMVEYFARILSRVKGRTFEDGHVYHRNPKDDYWDGCDPTSQPFIAFSEPGALHVKIAANSGDNAMNEFLSLADSAPYALPMAALELKGKVYANPEAIIMDCNDPALNLNVIFNSPSAPRRRIVFVEVNVKPEFQIKGSCRLDAAKALASDLPSLDRWIFKVYVLEPVNLKESIAHIKYQGNIFGLTDFITQNFTDHIELQKGRMVISNSMRVSDYLGKKVDNGYDSDATIPEEAESEDDDIIAESMCDCCADKEISECKEPCQVKTRCDKCHTEYEPIVHFKPYPVSYKEKFREHFVHTRYQFNRFKGKAHMVLGPLNSLIYFTYIKEFCGYMTLSVLSWSFLSLLRALFSTASLFAPAGITKTVSLRMLKTKINTQKRIFSYRYNNFRMSMGMAVDKVQVIVKPHAADFCSYLAVFSVLIIIVRLMRTGTIFMEHNAEGNVIQTSSDRTEEEVDIFISNTENVSGCALPPPRLARKNAVKWDNIAHPPRSIGDPVQYNAQDKILRTVNKNIRIAACEGATHVISTTIMGICEDIAIINRHSLASPKSNGLWHIQVAEDEPGLRKAKKVNIDNNEIKQVIGDIFLIRVRGCKFKDIRKYFFKDEIYVNSYGIQGVIESSEIVVKSGSDLHAKSNHWNDVTVHDPLQYEWSGHAAGKCGTPIFVTNGKAFGIAGFHCAGSQNTLHSFGQRINLHALQRAYHLLNESSCVMNIYSEGAVRLPIGMKMVPRTKDRSCLNFEEVPGLTVYGSIEGLAVMRPGKSKIQSTEFIRVAEELTGVSPFDSDGNPIFVPPAMSSRINTEPDGTKTFRAPYNNFVKKAGVIKKSLNPKIMRKTISVVTEHIISELAKVGVTRLHPIPLEVAQNGFPLDAYMRAMKPSTSGGFIWPGPKKKHSVPINLDFKEDSYMPIWDVKEQVQEQILAYVNHEDAHPLLGAQLKDEPRKLKKFLNCETRVFCMSSYESTLLNRMYLMPFYSLMVAHGGIFGCSVGINMHSTDIDDFVHEMEDFVEPDVIKNEIPFLFEGDYSNFDMSMPIDIGLMANTVAYNILKRLQYNFYCLDILKGLFSDNLYPLIVMLGNLFTAPSQQPSGKYATAEDNSLRGLIMLVYFWISTCTQFGKDAGSEHNLTTDFMPEQFFDYVLSKLYGDDVLAAIKKVIRKYFNNNIYKKFCKEVYGIGFTNALKTAVMEDLLPLKHASFLKRNFVYNDELKHWTAPLDKLSIMKSICYILPSKTVSKEEQLIDSCVSAMRELFFHLDATEFEKRRNLFAFYCADFFGLDIVDLLKVFPRYEAIRSSIYDHSNDHLTEDEMESDIIFTEVNGPLMVLTESQIIKLLPVLDTPNVGNKFMESNNLNKRTNLFLVAKQEQNASPITGNPAIDSLDLVDLIARRDLGENVRTRTDYAQRFRALAALDAIKATEVLMARRKKIADMKKFQRRETRGYIAESKEIGDMDMGAVTNTQVYNNLTEHAGEEPTTTTAGVSLHATPDGGATQYALNDFFERPVSLYDNIWNTATNYNVILKPWNQWSLDASVRAKLSNYAYFKGTMNIKISTTGTPYHYGRLMIAYYPYAKYNENLVAYDKLIANPASSITSLPAYKCYVSQSPGISYIDVKENEPVILKIPFVSHKAKWRLFNESTSVITNTTEFVDFEEAGELRLISLNKLAVANDDYDSNISMNVYSWVTDIELGCITATDMNIVAESGVGQKIMSAISPKDEYSDPGPISTIASAVGKAGDALSNIPVIGHFAKATSTVAKALGRVADLFGWSKPVILTNAIFTKTMPFTNGAVVACHDTAYKITLDPKQELSVDQSYGGCTEDEMTIAAVAGRESFLTEFTWADTDAAMSKVLWKSAVVPYLYQAIQTHVGMTEEFIQPTSMGFAVTPFHYWRGTIQYRFEIVCSKFHRGKLLFKYDPNFAQYPLILGNTTKLNQQNTVILDIQDGQDITFSVDWAHQRSWANVGNNTGLQLCPAETPPCDLESAAANFISIHSPSTNGFIEVRAINELVQPTTAAVIKINVYVKCEDLAVNRMTVQNMPTHRTIYTSESKDISKETINATGAKVDANIYLDHFGEKIVSFRSLLKRFTTSGVTDNTSTLSGNGIIRVIGNTYPPIAATYNGRGDATVMVQTLYQYLRFAYMGIRGGMRYRLMLGTDAVTYDNGYQKVQLGRDYTSFPTKYDTLTRDLKTVAEVVGTGSLNNLSTIDGAVVFHMGTNGGIEFEIPYYSNNLFEMSSSRDLGFSEAAEFGSGYSLFYASTWAANFKAIFSNPNNSVTVVDSSTAEDFTFLRYQGAPYYSQPIIP